jgi:hypothetical protein
MDMLIGLICSLHIVHVLKYHCTLWIIIIKGELNVFKIKFEKNKSEKTQSCARVKLSP